MSKVWVKAGTYDAGSRSKNFHFPSQGLFSTLINNYLTFSFNKTEEDNREKGKLYKPQTKHEEKTIERLNDYGKMSSPSSVSKKDAAAALKKSNKIQEKKKSNLELFKEELRQ